ncbi:MAG TPA: metallopeptidase TldD-related protein [Candidatus Limnocylindria bacterium]|nr:metallopeptidase TldD-related protein [Candidatus Limnocylindria bacterium]
MTSSDFDAVPDLAARLPRELVSELLALGRASGAEFAEVYAEHNVQTAFTLEEDRLKSSRYSVLQGVGVRAVHGEQTGYAYADGFAPDDLREAARVAARIAREEPAGEAPRGFRVVDAPAPFTLACPAPTSLDEPAKIELCRRANHAARAHDGRIHEVSVSLADASKSFLVANSDHLWAEDRQFLTRLTVSALALAGTERQQGFAAAGGCVEARYFDQVRTPEAVASEAAAMAITLLAAHDPEAGAYPVVVSPGWGGVMVHECFGHSMEGDTIRKHTSIRATQMGQHVASKGVTIVDSGLVPYSRGSFRVDDEGTPSQRTVLVEDGVLVGYLWDWLNGRLTGHPPTGNGRRNSYRDYPLCRMTNTYIEAGPHRPEDLIASVSRGLYCKSLGGGSVNPADGNFSFQVTEAYQIENGKLTHPVRNATLAGNGNDAMLKIDAVANDLEIDGTRGSCGKNGQWKPVGVGQPTVKFREITVGGTQA